ncbi:MAG: hypothetical protein ACN6NT_08625, partial [Comamonas sp.]
MASNDVGDAQWLQLRVGQALRIEHCEISVENILSQLEPSVSAVVVMFDARSDLTRPTQLVQW